MAATTWSSKAGTGSLSTTTSSTRTVGSATGTGAWGSHTWVRNDFSDANFRLRLGWSCGSTRTVSVDVIDVRVTYVSDVMSTTTSIQQVDVHSPTGGDLDPQNFWGALQSQGAPNIQGDAYMTWYDTRTSATNDDHEPDQYYQYAIEFPPGSTTGEVWVFDPGFCDVGTSRGTGENWTVGGANGYTSRQPISTFYRLYDTNNTPYNTGDDTIAGTSGSSYRRMFYSDHVLGQTAATDCSSVAWHNDWWQVGIGLQGGRTYRLHVFSTDESDAERPAELDRAQRVRDLVDRRRGHAAGLRARGDGGVHPPAGRPIVGVLPGPDRRRARRQDDGHRPVGPGRYRVAWPLTCRSSAPGGHSYKVTPFSYTATRNSGAASSCGSRTGTNVTSVTTNTGGTSLFNGCWLTHRDPAPGRTTRRRCPSNDRVATEGGWWKIRYNMSGSTSSNSTDLTTWQVSLRGSPVHLVLE